MSCYLHNYFTKVESALQPDRFAFLENVCDQAERLLKSNFSPINMEHHRLVFVLAKFRPEKVARIPVSLADDPTLHRSMIDQML